HAVLLPDLALDPNLPLASAARPALRTINHTLLTLEAARTAGLDVRGVVLTPWEGGGVPESNLETIELIGNVAVTCLPPIARDGLAEAGAQLPLNDWLRPAQAGPGSRAASG